MFKKSFYTVFALTVFFLFSIIIELKAEINFDFGLPLYRQSEINFEKTKTVDYNLQLLKKYILEHKGNVIAQFHAINRWFNLIKLSDTPKHAELLKVGNEYFAIKDKKKADAEEKLRNIFYTGIMLCNNKNEDPECKEDQKFEEILLEYEDDLHEKAEYWIAKGILFQTLKSRTNNYFVLMKPEEDLKIALTLIPRTSQYYYVLGQCFRYLGNSDSALFLSIASYEKAASLDPRNQKLQNSLLSIYMGLHEEYQAKGKHEPFWLEEAVYKKIIEIAPNNPYALNNLGYLYAEYGVNTQIAEDLCQKAVNQSPDNPGFLDSLGWAAFKNKNYKLAEDSLLKSIAIKGNIYESRYHLATLYYSLNNYEKAAEQYEKAITYRPESAEALNNLAYLYTELNINNEKSLTMAKLANRLEPNNASYVDTLGWAYYRNGDLDNALTQLLKANTLVPAQSEILLHIGRVYLDKNEFENALTYIKEAFKANPNLNDPDETLYLAIRLKSYYESIANYHGLLGEKAEKAKVLSILMDISRLYQEVGQFKKSIEITQICSQLNSGEKTLNEPLLNTYKIHKNEKNKDLKIDSVEKSSALDSNENDSSNLKQPETEVQEPESEQETKSQQFTFPKGIDYPVAVSFCSDFFKNLQKYFPHIKDLCQCNVTIIIDRVLGFYETAIIRISSDKLSGKDLKEGILTAYGCFKKPTEKEPDFYIFPCGKFYCKTTEHEIYFSEKPLDEATIKSLANLLPYKEDCLMEIYYDNEALLKRFPKMMNAFIKNPFRPFIKLQASYKLSDTSINELIIGTTGKKENDDFLRRIAGRLFRFKMRANRKGLVTSIKMKPEDDLVYISTDFENIIEWLTNKVDSLTNRLDSYIKLLKTLSNY